VDFGFVANRGRGKGLKSKVAQFVSNLDVARYYETACFALKCMVYAELLEAAIAVRWKVRRAPGVPQE
jgi:hypothetical protein